MIKSGLPFHRGGETLKKITRIMIDKKLLLIAALLLASCTSDLMTEGSDGGSQNTAASHKIVNTSVNAEAGSLLVYFDDAAIGSLEQAAEAAAKTRSVATRAVSSPWMKYFRS